MVAATLLDLKAARLLPSGEMTDTEDLALLEARDLLFARLLQYRAYKQIAALLVAAAGRSRTAGTRAQVGPEPRFAALLPEVPVHHHPGPSWPRSRPRRWRRSRPT